jgi:hypothetical protein
MMASWPSLGLNLNKLLRGLAGKRQLVLASQ